MAAKKPNPGFDHFLRSSGASKQTVSDLPRTEVPGDMNSHGDLLPVGLRPEHLTEQGVALAFIAKYGHDLLYVEQLGTWFVWDGTHFREDRDRTIRHRLGGLVTTRYPKLDEYNRNSERGWIGLRFRELGEPDA